MKSGWGDLTVLAQVKMTTELDDKLQTLANIVGVTKAEVLRRLIGRAKMDDVMPDIVWAKLVELRTKLDKLEV